ncbi:oxaloacetate decarboxylase [Ahrensia sp. 13_GOM-1096m]|uniref:isocitrate lyase/PEP mutase family protein n=1 Tax=Ahrensia sp. 13_GOM-1096m TaxID=1380380 RepID=UPI00047C499C|nr:isocitrate lyase/phosphoenolpyruvate mutase family protein [Ahrensia sp. 13_GOM-1096m]
MTTLAQRHADFHDLHQSGCFVIPNPWDIGSAKLMAANGAKALATTSAGLAFTLGVPDMGRITRDQALSHAEDLIRNTNLPISGDLENGFGHSPEDVAETIRLAGEAGLSGCSIEDTYLDGEIKTYTLEEATDRIAAGANAARALGRPFVFCARADGIMNGTYDTDEAIKRLQAFEKAGADLLYAPLPPSMDALAKIVRSVNTPINALAAGPFRQYNVQDFAKIGVRRISVGSALARVTHHHIVQATAMMCNEGDFSGLNNAASGDAIDAMLERATPS